MIPTVSSVNVALPVLVEGHRSAIDKQPVTGPVEVGLRALAGDGVANRRFHGHPWQAVYAYEAEELAHWATALGADLRPGLFGENLTTTGLDTTGALIGEQWRIGTALLEVASVRLPCQTFQRQITRHGYDAKAWVRRFVARGRPGVYLAVLEEGVLATGDAIEVVHRPDHDIEVATMFAAMTTDRDLLARVATIPLRDRALATEILRFQARSGGHPANVPTRESPTGLGCLRPPHGSHAVEK